MPRRSPASRIKVIRVRIALVVIAAIFVAACTSTSTEDTATAGNDTEATGATPDPTVTPSPTASPEPTAVPVPATADDSATATIVYGDQFPEVLAVEMTLLDDQNWRFNVTLSSPYDTPERYADAWRVLDADDNELGIRVLGHDHANEQPFTRSHTIQVPQALTTVYVEGRDQDNGWSGQRFEVELP